MKEQTESVDSYIAGFPVEVQERLQAVRAAIAAVLPDDATEALKYRMPTFMVGSKNVIHFAGFNEHLGIYPVTDLPPELEERLGPHRAGKGTAQFRYADPLPTDLIQDLARYLLARRQGS